MRATPKVLAICWFSRVDSVGIARDVRKLYGHLFIRISINSVRVSVFKGSLLRDTVAIARSLLSLCALAWGPRRGVRFSGAR